MIVVNRTFKFNVVGVVVGSVVMLLDQLDDPGSVMLPILAFGQEKTASSQIGGFDDGHRRLVRRLPIGNISVQLFDKLVGLFRNI